MPAHAGLITRASMSHPLTRVLTLLELLQSNAGLTGAELADRLKTDVRTVRRYTAHLRELGIPVEAERSCSSTSPASAANASSSSRSTGSGNTSRSAAPIVRPRQTRGVTPLHGAINLLARSRAIPDWPVLRCARLPRAGTARLSWSAPACTGCRISRPCG
jgi:biotin operon repressor